MAKKEKKEKGSRKKRAKKEVDPILANAPYKGSDLLKSFLAKVLIILCVFTMGMMIYTIHYFRYVEKKNLRIAQAAADSASAERAAASRGTIWFSMPDGSFLSGGKNTKSPLSQMPPVGGTAGSQSEPAAQPEAPSPSQELPDASAQ